MSREKELSKALNFVTNWQFKTPGTRKIMADLVLKLRLGSELDQVAAEELNNLLVYQGSLEAINSVSYILKALKTPQGRRAAGLLPKPKEKKYSAKNVKQTDPIFQVMMKREFKLATDEDVQEAASEAIGDDRDLRTLNRFCSDLLPTVKVQANLFKIMDRMRPKENF